MKLRYVNVWLRRNGDETPLVRPRGRQSNLRQCITTPLHCAAFLPVADITSLVARPVLLAPRLGLCILYGGSKMALTSMSRRGLHGWAGKWRRLARVVALRCVPLQNAG